MITPKSPGRPTKFNEETIARLCAAVADGLSIKSACVVAAIGVTTLAEWRQEHPELEERMTEARELARQKALQTIWLAGDKDWRARAEWLRLTFPADYRGLTSKLEVSATAQASSGFVLTIEQQEELRRRCQQALASPR